MASSIGLLEKTFYFSRYGLRNFSAFNFNFKKTAFVMILAFVLLNVPEVLSSY